MTQTWFITGSSRGLGRAITENALAAGDNVVATARNLTALADLVAKYGTQLYPLQLDVSDSAAVTRAITAATQHFNQIDVLVNNAGYANMAAIEETDLADFKAQMDTDFYGTLSTIQAVLPQMRERRAGHIINISSIGGRTGSAGLGAYQSAKFAVNGLTEVLGIEVAPFNIQVTTVEPGGMKTDWGGKSMAVATDSHYQETVGQAVTMIHNAWETDNTVRYASDPTKVATVIYKLSEMTAAPRHLLIGKDAAQSASDSAKKLAESDEKYRALTNATGF
ncbi:SDR family NAD(P)-dependent oxidoreductase [Furfurilactobacillus siliginis]|uniref:Oxidoreductase n=1 Tax=Furfurilactobacillus siliginis TaxID=348151 RepID=A0A0R2L751_9LACO|nr:SDR family NAD(P)-dependent oxidoreductase [Furfurilactobacillus siliginis]KRN97281.1 oxidoreductase [Furfurilactobacillus siliginis]GEK28592.1 short-chain dehydrogenase/reductase [Furfurilactobacillus siliginis]